MLAVSVCLGAVGRQALRRRVDETARDAWLDSVPTGAYTGDDPVGYVQNTFGGVTEIDTYETDGVLFVLTDRGVCVLFLANGDGTFSEVTGFRPLNGRFCAADPYGPQPYPCRLMGADGAVIEPVYEARFSTGYVPVYVIDVPEGQDCAFLEYGVDADGTPRYEYGRTDCYLVTDAHVCFTREQVRGAASGPDFLAAYEAYRRSLLTTEPDAVSDHASLGQPGGYALWTSTAAPPSLTITWEGGTALVAWGGNSFDEAVYPGDTPYFTRKTTCAADVTALLDAEEVTEDMLRTAAASALSEAAATTSPWSAFTTPYATTRTWYVPPPEDVLALADAVFRELTAEGE